MASIKIVLRKKVNKDGTYPLAIRITKDRRSSFIHIGEHLKKSEWDSINKRVKKSHSNSARLNNFLAKKFSEAHDKLLELGTTDDHVSSQQVKHGIAKRSRGSSFFAIADNMYIANFKKAKKYNRLSTEQPRIKRFRTFLKESDIAFNDITVPLLTRYRAYLKGTHNISERSIINHLLVIRTIYNLAIKEGVAEAKNYPFGKDKIQIKFPQSLKIGLDANEVKTIEELKLKKGSAMNHAQNIWLFAFYFAGMRISDVLRLRWSDFQNDRLYYKMGKNTKPGSLKISQKVSNILSQYEDEKRNDADLVFPELKVLENLNNSYDVERKIAYADKRLNGYLRKVAKQAKIKKKFTLHIARHTFGNISGERISVQMLQKLYRHSSISTTIGYQSNFIHKDADEALDAVVSL